MTLRTPAVHVRCAVALPLGNVIAQEKVVHGDAAAGVPGLAPPVAAPLVDALGVRVPERLQGDLTHAPDQPGV
jgi:hypothetical protein